MGTSNRSPPMTPERFKLEMEKRKSRAESKGVPLFTNGADQPFILDKYVAAFNQQVLARVYDFGGMGWSQLADIKCLVEVLVHCQALEWLNLGANQMGDEGVKELSKGLVHLSNLKVLDLSETKMGDEGVEELSKGLVHLRNLKVLNLYGNDFGDAGAEKLA